MIDELIGWYCEMAVDYSDDGDGSDMRLYIDEENYDTLDERIDWLNQRTDEQLEEIYSLYVKSTLVKKEPELPEVFRDIFGSFGL